MILYYLGFLKLQSQSPKLVGPAGNDNPLRSWLTMFSLLSLQVDPMEEGRPPDPGGGSE